MKYPAISVSMEDITTLVVDAIVNAANNTLLGGGGVDGAIHRAAGKELVAYCRMFDGCETGDAVITPGFNLPAKHVIHTVGPVWRGGHNNEAKLLAQCYERSLLLAEEVSLKSIAFPAISCGIYGYPHDEATRIAFESVSKARPDNSSLKEIILIGWDEGIFSRYKALIEANSKLYVQS
ncbi:O-acetyl-ADP-ribose deacetylase [Pseudomonas aeruginosa]